MLDLNLLTDEQLQAEINHRTKEKEERRKQELEAKKILVYCPECEGKGIREVYNEIHYSPDTYSCDLCKGRKTIIAIKVEK